MTSWATRSLAKDYAVNDFIWGFDLKCHCFGVLGEAVA